MAVLTPSLPACLEEAKQTLVGIPVDVSSLHLAFGKGKIRAEASECPSTKMNVGRCG